MNPCLQNLNIFFIFVRVSFSLEDPGADPAHGVRLPPQAVLGHVVLQHPQPHGLAPDHDKLIRSQMMIV